MRPSPPLAAALAAAVVFAVAPPVGAHSEVSEGVDRHLQLFVNPQGVIVQVEIHHGETPSQEELAELDSDGDGVVSDEERKAYERHLLEHLAGELRLRIGGEVIPLRQADVETRFQLGPGGLTELTIRATYRLPWPDGLMSPPPERIQLRIEDRRPRAAGGFSTLRVAGTPDGAVRYRIERPPRKGGVRSSGPTGARVVYRLPVN